MKMKWLVLVSVLLGLSALGPRAIAAGFIIVDEAHWWPEPIPPHPLPPRPWPPAHRHHAFAPLEVENVNVQTRINDQVATTSVAQEFYNPNSARLEGTFIFPIAKGAHINKFTMDIDGKAVEAELLAADKARHIYEDIVRKLKDPALLEYAGRDVFKVRIFPIEPNSRKRVTISYTQLLKSDEGLVSYSLPLSTEQFSPKPLKNVSLKVELETKRPLKSIYSPTHAVEIKRHGSTSATVGYEAGDVQPDTDFALYFAPEKDELGVNLLASRVAGEDGYFLLLASPGMDVKENQVVAKDVVFVLDTSGSMAGKKMEQAKKALSFCVENLNDNDRFELLRFSTEVEPLFDKLAEATSQNRAKAQSFVNDLRANGGTAIDDALKKALKLAPGNQRDEESADSLTHHETRPAEAPSEGGSRITQRPFVIIFLTDGRPTIGATDEETILSHVKVGNGARTRIFCFGIGTDVNTHLLDHITEETRAFSQYVLPEEDLEIKVSSFFSKIKDPVLANPVIKFSGDIRVTSLYPSPLPDLFRGEQLVLAGRYSGRGDSAITIEGTVNGAAKKFTYEVRFPEESSENDFIPRLWATRRVGYLLDEIRLHGENSELRDEATELARKYGIVTPYTAYLIVEDEARREVPVPMRSFRMLNDDKDARHEAAANWNYFKNEIDGEKAVSGARFGMALKAAQAPAVAAASGAIESERALGLSLLSPAQIVQPSDRSKARLMEYSQQTRYVAGKNFFQNENQWVDSAIQKSSSAKNVRIQFGSAEYFELLTAKPKSSPWLALGQNVRFVLDGTVYEIYE
jgi:Ca-activated chloride channel family protein